MVGWFLAVLTWVYVYFVILPATDPTVIVKEAPIPPNAYIVETVEKSTCKTGTDETLVWKTVKSFKLEEYPMVTDDTPLSKINVLD
jgi:hypothetical protein